MQCVPPAKSLLSWYVLETEEGGDSSSMTCFSPPLTRLQSRATLPGGWKYLCAECAPAHSNAHRPWTESLYSTMLNLQQVYGVQGFHQREELCVYIDKHWKLLCGTRPRTPFMHAPL